MLYQSTKYLYRLARFYLLAIFVTSSVAAEQEKSYQLPGYLSSYQLETNADLDNLMLSTEMFSDLRSIVKTLPEEIIKNENMFTKVALLSLLNNHQELLTLIDNQANSISYYHYELFHKALLKLPVKISKTLNELVQTEFEAKLSDVDNKTFVKLTTALAWTLADAKQYVLNILKPLQSKDQISSRELLNFVSNIQLLKVLMGIIPITQKEIEIEISNRFIVEPNKIVSLPNGITLSTTIVRAKHIIKPMPAALQYTIYADEDAHIKSALFAAAHGYIGIIGNTRGKRSSKNKIVPWEHEGEDASLLIDWITKQTWNDGNVVMYGGSYNGFTQWAATKYMPKGLKAISPFVAANLITGLPYENNIALTGNFEWALYATNNKTTDSSIYSNRQRTNRVISDFYKSGRPINELDVIAEAPSPWLKKWLAHPEDDSYYQSMVPHKQEYEKINIPVLTITGYFDVGQISAIHYLKEHYKYNPNADHTLLIGPYDHITSQYKPRSTYSNYKLDPVALEKDTEELVFSWFDHVLFGANKPMLLRDKVNYQVMGSNQWRSFPSYSELSNRGVSYYISTDINNDTQTYSLTEKNGKANTWLEQVIDLTDRSEQRNVAPWPVIQTKIPDENGLILQTAPFDQPLELSGEITGYLDITINKKDVDIGFNFYEISSTGEVFHLNTYRSRASFADNMSSRNLLSPGKLRRVPIVNARSTAKLIKKGSRLAIVLNVNKNEDAQVNMGSGKPVNEESIVDAGDPLIIKWFASSKINIPLKPWVN